MLGVKRGDRWAGGEVRGRQGRRPGGCKAVKVGRVCLGSSLLCGTRPSRQPATLKKWEERLKGKWLETGHTSTFWMDEKFRLLKVALPFSAEAILVSQLYYYFGMAFYKYPSLLCKNQVLLLKMLFFFLKKSYFKINEQQNPNKPKTLLTWREASAPWLSRPVCYYPSKAILVVLTQKCSQPIPTSWNAFISRGMRSLATSLVCLFHQGQWAL